MSSSSGRLDDSGMMEVTGKILIATIVALFVVIILVFLFHIYARWLWLRRQQHIDSDNVNHRRHNSAGVTVLRRGGLDASFLKTLPISQFDSKDFKDGCLECSVCLSEVQQGEDTRILPKCHHAFHAECIDMWFHSHSTCPICRTLVSDQQQTQVSVESLLHQNQQQDQSTNNNSTGGDSFPANVLFWGDETEVSTLTSQLEELEAANQHPISLPFEPTSTSSSSSSTSQTNDDRLKKPDLVIDIPRASRHAGDNNEEDQSTPMMRSLRRILSSSRRFYPFSPSTPNNNIAQ